MSSVRSSVLCVCSLLLMLPARALAQHDHSKMTAPPSGGWQFMHEAIVFAEFNHQGGPRGGDEFVVPNWWMGMATRDAGRGRLTLMSMLSLDPVTVGKSGYRELFQAGEALDGRPIVDRQHPHDFFMQLSASYRVPLSASTGFTISGGPAAEPALGPTAFMHRASAFDNPTAPLSHHTFDSTHIAFGVVTAAIDRGPLVVEGSVFNGREPDEDRWGFDFGKLDSFSGRMRYQVNGEWSLQASSGRLTQPEQLEPGDVVRSTASATWTRAHDGATTSVTAGFGVNGTDHGARSAFFLEGARRWEGYTIYSRFETLSVNEAIVDDAHSNVVAFTIGGVRDVFSSVPIKGGFGADVSVYGVPSGLERTYSAHPVSFHVFFRLRR